MTRLERIRGALTNVSPLMDSISRKDVAWLVETVDLLAKELRAIGFYADQHSKRALARLEEPR